jgi:hypothetical protein
MTTADVIAFLQAGGIDVPIYPEGEEESMPDEIVTVAVQSGMSSTFEYLFDRPAIRIRIRGSQFDRASAEALGAEVDAAMLRRGPVQIGGKHVTVIQRFSGPPGFVGIEAASSRRAILEATYIPEIAR